MTLYFNALTVQAVVDGGFYKIASIDGSFPMIYGEIIEVRDGQTELKKAPY